MLDKSQHLLRVTVAGWRRGRIFGHIGDEIAKFRRQLGWINRDLWSFWCERVARHKPVHRVNGMAEGHIDDADSLAVCAESLPKRQAADVARVVQPPLIVVARVRVAEMVNAVFTGIRAGDQARPRRRCQRGDGRIQSAPRALAHKPLQRRHVAALGERFQVRPRRSIESDDKYARGGRDGLCCRSHGRVV